MADQGTEKDGLTVRISEQVQYITDVFAGDKDSPVVDFVPSHGGIEFMYAVGQILVRDGYLERVQRLLGQPVGIDGHLQDPKDRPSDSKGQQDSPGDARRGRGLVNRVVSGVLLLHLTKSDFDNKQPTVIEALNRIAEQFGEGVAAPNHVLTVAPEVGPCPATEPQIVYDEIEPSPGICTGNSGAGVLVYVADTGLLEDTASHPWLQGVQRALKPDGTLQNWDPLGPGRPETDGRPEILPYTGHGTFVAGVARCMAPQVDMIVSNVFKVAGSTLESDFVKELDTALDLGVDIFNLSITAPTRKALPLLAFEEWLKHLHQHKGVVCVVASGNNGNRLPCWPAAFPQMVSVGALAANLRDRASFSNFGGWVDVYAPGRGLINAFATGTYICRVEPYKDQKRKFFGMCRWSGTSFSTPVVTGLIAARMSRTGENGQQAAAALLAEAQSQAISDVGAILLPRDGGDRACQVHPVECCCRR